MREVTLCWRVAATGAAAARADGAGRAAALGARLATPLPKRACNLLSLSRLFPSAAFSMITWIGTSRLSIKNPLPLAATGAAAARTVPPRTALGP